MHAIFVKRNIDELNLLKNYQTDTQRTTSTDQHRGSGYRRPPYGPIWRSASQLSAHTFTYWRRMRLHTGY